MDVNHAGEDQRGPRVDNLARRQLLPRRGGGEAAAGNPEVAVPYLALGNHEPPTTTRSNASGVQPAIDPDFNALG